MLRWRPLAFLLVLSLLPRRLFSHEPTSAAPSAGVATVDNPPDFFDLPDEPLDINTICSKVAFPERCLSSIHSEAPGPLDAIDPDTALKLEMVALHATTEAARNKAREIAADPMTDARIKSTLLRSCIGFYESALSGYLKKISIAQSDEDAHAMKSLIGNFTVGCNGCGEAFARASLSSPMQVEDDAIKELAANGMSLVLAFWPSSPQPFQFTPVTGGDIEPADGPMVSLGKRQAYTFRDKLSVETICGRCMHAERCLTSVVRSVAKGTAIGSLVDATTIMNLEMNALHVSITAAMERAQALTKDAKIHAYTRSDLLSRCIGLYRQALMELERCKKALAENNREAMTGSFSSIAGVSDSTESVFADAYTVSLLREENGVIRELASNCLDIASEFWPQPDAVASNSAESAAPSPAMSMAPADTDPQGVEFVCSKAKHPDRCLSSAVAAAAGPLDAADALTVLKLEINSIILEIKATREKTESLIDDPNTKPRFKAKLLPGCHQALERSYYDAMEVGKLLARNDIGRPKGLLTSVANYLYTCHIHAKNVVGSPIQLDTDELVQLLDNGISIMGFFWPMIQSPTSSPIPSSSGGPPTCSAPDAAAAAAADEMLSLDQLHARTPEAAHLISGPRGPRDPLDLRTICSVSVYHDQCLSAVKAIAKGPLGSADADAMVTSAVDVLQLTIQASINLAKKLAEKAAAYTKIPNINDRTLRVFDACGTMYRDMTKRLETASKWVTEQEAMVAGIGDDLKVAKDNCGCKILFDEAGLVMPMRAGEEELEQLLITNTNIASFFWPGNWI